MVEEPAPTPPEPEPESDEEDEVLEAMANMELSDEAREELEPIPAVLHSDYEEGLFTSCSVCDALLRNGAGIYHIEKVMRGGECVFEMALCMPCAIALHKKYSKESKAALRAYFRERYLPSDDLEACHLCRARAPEGDDRVVSGACWHDRLLLPAIVVCGECVEGTQAILSQKTREAFRDFIDLNFPGVPAEWEPLPMIC